MLYCDRGITSAAAARSVTDADGICAAPPAELGNTTFGPILRDYFVSFAVELDPNRWATVANKTVWPRFEVGTESVLEMGLTGIEVKDPDASSQCKGLEDAGLVGH